MAPAYDVTYAYNPGGLWTGSHQMMINGKRDDVLWEDCAVTASQMSIKAARAKEIAAQVREAVALWQEFADKAGLPEETALSLQRRFVLLDRD